MKRPPPIGYKALPLRNRLGKAGLPTVILFVGLCTLTQALATDDSGTPAAKLPAAAPVAEAQAALAEAKKRLAEVMAEHDKMGERFAQSRASLADAKQSLNSVTAERDKLNEQLAAEQAARTKAEEALAAVTAERDKLSSTLAQTHVMLGDTKQSLTGVTAERDYLTEELRQAHEEQQKLRDSLDQSRSTAAGLRKEIAVLQAELPMALGGSASLQTLQDAAGKLATELRTTHKALRRKPSDTVLKERNNAAAIALRRRQLLIASATGAGGLYQLQLEDTLTKVARRFYGDGNRWFAVYQANNHVLENPDEVIPGLMLILP